jgi:GT2 family glycosyltransferase
MDDRFAVLIPERGRPDLLAKTLRALATACAVIDTPCRVHILVNGARAPDYRLLIERHRDMDWCFHPRPLGYHGAIGRLLRMTEAPWVYLLNSDMQLESSALAELLTWRHPDVFAIASQIEFADRTRRREETGWTFPVRNADGQLELHDLAPPDETVRGTLYAGGGASLFQAAMLRQYFRRSCAYAPFYFEDADWSVQAWSAGASVLFCPSSRAVHVHRGTINRYVRPRTLQRIVQRNLAHFRWRYADLFNAPRWGSSASCRLGAAWRSLDPEHRLARRAVRESPARDGLAYVVHKRYPHAQRWRRRPRVLLVSPFAILPPAHGGARRIVELVRSTADRIDWVLLHDEAGARPQPSSSDDRLFREIHPVGGRPDRGPDWAVRWQDHAHTCMRAELSRLIASVRPVAVCFEHLECIGLIESLSAPIPFFWTLHDAGRKLPAAAADRVRAMLGRVDTLLLPTESDLGYWAHPRQRLIENGVRLTSGNSTTERRNVLLMVAPLRYEPNRAGLKLFLAEAWPSLRLKHPELRLRVLGGDASSFTREFLPLPEGVDLVERFVDPIPHYAESLCALNAQGAIEGSALKIAEALAHGRMIISTVSGARGYERLDSPALLRVPTVADMVPAIESVLGDQEARATAESRARIDVEPWSWRYRGDALVDLITDRLRG